MNKELTLEFEELETDAELTDADLELLQKAREAVNDAYAPYSGFRVAAAGRLANGTILTGTNQENASYPVGICAERTLLSTVGALFPNAPIDTIAISYFNTAPGSNSSKPASPCGICRQSLVEYEYRTGKEIRIILAGYTGKILVLKKSALLLPFGFTASDMA